MSKSFIYKLKVYYEDTDAAGIVYYANYLKFLERARSEAIYHLGFTNTELKKNFDTTIVVKSCSIEYMKPAIFEDNINVISFLKSMNRSSFTMIQQIKRKKELIASAEVRLVCINTKRKPSKIPDKLQNLIGDYIA